MCDSDVDMPRFVKEPKERVCAIVNNFCQETIPMEPSTSTQGKVMHRRVIVKISNHVVEILKLFFTKFHLMRLTGVGKVLETDARGH